MHRNTLGRLTATVCRLRQCATSWMGSRRVTDGRTKPVTGNSRIGEDTASNSIVNRVVKPVTSNCSHMEATCFFNTESRRLTFPPLPFVLWSSAHHSWPM